MDFLSKDTLKLIFIYISQAWERSKINKLFSSWSALLQGLPQESVSSRCTDSLSSAKPEKRKKIRPEKI